MRTAETSAAEGKTDDKGTASLTKFDDVPIPSNSSMDFSKSIVLGNQDGWIGRLTLDAGFSLADMYTFYEREMPKFGWQQVTVVRSAITTMTYTRNQRIATITLQPKSLAGSGFGNRTEVDFTVSPGRPLKS
ncbi:MAG: hypothetical protein OHK0024_36520 [Thalassobaculales bacterium]